MLIGARVRLRAVRDSDLAFFHELRNDFETQASLMTVPRPQTVEQVRHWLATRAGEHDQVFFVIADGESNEPAGFVELRSVQRPHGWAMLGICLARGARERGWGREALELIELFGRDVLGLRKLVLQVLASHVRATQLYARAGYRQIGVHQEHFCYGGQYHDVAVMEKQLNHLPAAELPWTR